MSELTTSHNLSVLIVPIPVAVLLSVCEATFDSQYAFIKQSIWAVRRTLVEELFLNHLTFLIVYIAQTVDLSIQLLDDLTAFLCINTGRDDVGEHLFRDSVDTRLLSVPVDVAGMWVAEEILNGYRLWQSGQLEILEELKSELDLPLRWGAGLHRIRNMFIVPNLGDLLQLRLVLFRDIRENSQNHLTTIDAFVNAHLREYL